MIPVPDITLLGWCLAVAGVLVFGISKGGFGGGAGMAAVPIMSLAMDPAEAVAILLPLLLLMDAMGLHTYRWKWDMAVMKAMLPGALAGIALGGIAFGVLPSDLVRLLLGVLSILFCVDYWRPRKVIGDHTPKPSNGFGAFMGAVSGFTSTVAHAGAPPANFYLLPLRLDKTVFVASMTLFFALINIIKLVPYLTLGLFDSDVLILSACLAPCAIIAMYLGILLHRVMSREQFYRYAYLLVFVTGLKLLYDGALYFI